MVPTPGSWTAVTGGEETQDVDGGVAKIMSQREEKVLRMGWKRMGRKRTWGNQVEITTAGPRARDSSTEGTTALHTTFQVQFQ